MSAFRTSKAFRARLRLRDHEVSILERWAARNFALHAIFDSDGQRATVLIGLGAAPQTSVSFARTIRNALRRLGVSTVGLRGHWCFFVSEREAISVCVGYAGFSLQALRRAEENRRHPSPPSGDDGKTAESWNRLDDSQPLPDVCKKNDGVLARRHATTSASSIALARSSKSGLSDSTVSIS